MEKNNEPIKKSTPGETPAMGKNPRLVSGLTSASLIFGAFGVFILAVWLIGFFIMTNYRQSPWFWPVARVAVLFPIMKTLYVFLGLGVCFGAFAVAVGCWKRARLVLPVAALALAVVEIGAIQVASVLFARQSPLYSAYLNFTSSARRNNAPSSNAFPSYKPLAPLMKAAEAGKTEEVRTLLKEGADPFEKDASGLTAGELAVADGHLETVRIFLEDADLERNKRYLGDLLLVAAVQDRPEIARLLLDHHAEIDRRGFMGMSPLMHAIDSQNWKVAEILLESGADVNMKNPQGWNVLTMAVLDENLNMVRMVLDHGANINTQSAEGWTPLMAACNVGNQEIVKLLVERGASLNMRDKNGHTAMGWAAHEGHADLVRLLQQAGARE